MDSLTSHDVTPDFVKTISKDHINTFFKYNVNNARRMLPTGLQEELDTESDTVVTLYRKSTWELTEKLLKFNPNGKRGAIIRGSFGAGIELNLHMND
jgi:hypothetical protein